MTHQDYSKNLQAQEALQRHMNLANESIRARSLVCETKSSKLQNAEQYYHKVKSQMNAAMPNWKSSHNSLSSSNPASNPSTGDSTTSSYSYLSGAGMPAGSISDINLQQLADDVANARARVEMLRMERNLERKWLEDANLGLSRLRLAADQCFKPADNGGGGGGGVFVNTASPHELNNLSSQINKLKDKLSQGEHERRHYLQELAALLQKQSQLTCQPQLIPKTNCSVQTEFHPALESDRPPLCAPPQPNISNTNNFGQLALLKLQYRDLCTQIDQLHQTMVQFEAKHPPREWTGQLSTDRVQLVMQLKEHLLKTYQAHDHADLSHRLNQLEADIKREWEVEWQRVAFREQFLQAMRHKRLLSEQIQSLSNTTLSSFSSESSLTSSLGSLNSLSGADVIYRMPPPYIVSTLNQNTDPRANTQPIVQLTNHPPPAPCSINSRQQPINKSLGTIIDQSHLSGVAEAQTLNRLSSTGSSHHYCNLPGHSSYKNLHQLPPPPLQPLEAELPETEPPNYESHVTNVLRRAANRYYVNVSGGGDALQSTSYLPGQEEECRSVSAAVSNESVAGDSGVFEAKLEASLFLQLCLQLSFDYHSQSLSLHIQSVRNLSIIHHLFHQSAPGQDTLPTFNQQISLKLDLYPRLSPINVSSSWMSLSGLLESSGSLNHVTTQITHIDQRFNFPLPMSALSQCALQIFLYVRSPEQVIGCCQIALTDLPRTGASNAYNWFPMQIWSSVPSRFHPLDWLPQREINDDYVNLASCNYLNTLGDSPSADHLSHLLQQSGCDQSPSLSASTPIYAYNNNSSSSEETPVGGMTASAATFIYLDDEDLATGVGDVDCTRSSSGPRHSVSASQPSTLTRTLKQEGNEQESNADDDSSQSDIDIPRIQRHKSVTKLMAHGTSNLNESKSQPTGSNLTAFLRHLSQRKGTLDQETSTLPVSSFAEPTCNSELKKTRAVLSSPERFIKRSQTYTGEKASTFSRESSTRNKILRKKGGSDVKARRSQQGDKTMTSISGCNSPSSLNRSESDSQLITGSTLYKLKPKCRDASFDTTHPQHGELASNVTEPTNYTDSVLLANLNLNLDLQALEQRLAEQARELSNLNRLTVSLQEKLEACNSEEERMAVLENLEGREPRLCQMIMQQLQLQNHLVEGDPHTGRVHRSKEERKVHKLLKQVDHEARQLRKESEGRPMKITLDEKLSYFTRGMRPVHNLSFESITSSSTSRPGSTFQPPIDCQPISSIALNNPLSVEHASSEV